METTKEEFKKLSGIDLTDHEHSGVFPYYKNGKWSSISRGKAWQMYAKWLEDKSTSQKETIERLRESFQEGDWAAYNWLDDEGNDNWKIGRIVEAPESKELMYYVDDETTRCGFIPITLGVKLLKNDSRNHVIKFREMLQKIVDAKPLDRWMHMKEAEQLLSTTESKTKTK